MQTPQPNTTANQPGPVQTMQYDGVGRIERVTNQTNGAYTRYVYPSGGTDVMTYTTVGAGAAEAYSAQMFDGVGRLRAVAEDHPGSAGGWRTVFHLYDTMGRRVRTTNPTEVNTGWTPVGDDAGGWVMTEQAYDWQGRPTLTTNADGTTSNAEYGGCGCAGGEVTTVRDEAGRYRRLRKDVFGRLARVEEMVNQTDVYSTATYSYNTRDQLTQINHSGQVRTLEYDGHARLWRRTTPEQGQTTYSYHADDTLSQTTDARGASATYAYNARHLVTGITYNAGGGAAQTPNVSFTYDAAGNRTGMDDGPGSVSYSYDELSRLTSETRTFDGVGSFGLQYQYNLAGGLTSVTNPWGAQVGYARDHVGQVTGVTGANYAGVTSYASNVQYRAFGAVKNQTYGNGRQMTQTFDNRLRLSQWNVAGVNGYNYRYDNFLENTGRVTYAQNLYDATLDRSFAYDHLGRMYATHAGSEARAHAELPGGQWNGDGPYSHNQTMDVWGNVTQRNGWVAGHTDRAAFTLAYTNNRVDGLQYDAAGNVTNDGGQTFHYDATGQQTYATDTALQMGYDGDRMRVRRSEDGQVTYFLRSSVLGGQVVAEMVNGSWYRGYVYNAGGQLLAVQAGGVMWIHSDPVAESPRETDVTGAVVSWVEMTPWGSGDGQRAERVATGAEVRRVHERLEQVGRGDAPKI